MRRQWLMALGVDVAIMGSVAVILALISADVLPASLMAPVIVVGMLLSALPFIYVGSILPGLATRRAKNVRQNGLSGLAEPLVEAKPLADAKMQGVGNYSGPEIFLDVPARVWGPDGGVPYETTIQASLFFAHFLRPGVKVTVKISPQDKNIVVLDDTMNDIVQRNPQLRRDA